MLGGTSFGVSDGVRTSVEGLELRVQGLGLRVLGLRV